MSKNQDQEHTPKNPEARASKEDLRKYHDRIRDFIFKNGGAELDSPAPLVGHHQVGTEIIPEMDEFQPRHLTSLLNRNQLGEELADKLGVGPKGTLGFGFAPQCYIEGDRGLVYYPHEVSAEIENPDSSIMYTVTTAPHQGDEVKSARTAFEEEDKAHEEFQPFMNPGALALESMVRGDDVTYRRHVPENIALENDFTEAQTANLGIAGLHAKPLTNGQLEALNIAFDLLDQPQA